MTNGKKQAMVKEETVRGKEAYDVVRDALDDCLNDTEATATEKLPAIVAAVGLLVLLKD